MVFGPWRVKDPTETGARPVSSEIDLPYPGASVNIPTVQTEYSSALGAAAFSSSLYSKILTRRLIMVDFLLSIVGLASLGGAIFEFYKFVTFPVPGGGHMNGWIALGLAIIFCACALLLFLRHVNKEEEIHITQ